MNIRSLTCQVLCISVCLLALPYIAPAQDQFFVIPVSGRRIVAIAPDDVVELRAQCAINEVKTLERISPSNVNSTLSIPEGKYLVITSMSIQPVVPGAGYNEGCLRQDFSERIPWAITSGQGQELHFSPGVIIASGSTLSIVNKNNSDNVVKVNVFGYFTDQ